MSLERVTDSDVEAVSSDLSTWTRRAILEARDLSMRAFSTSVRLGSTKVGAPVEEAAASLFRRIRRRPTIDSTFLTVSARLASCVDTASELISAGCNHVVGVRLVGYVKAIGKPFHADKRISILDFT